MPFYGLDSKLCRKKFDQPFYKLMLFFYCMHAKELRSIFPYLAQEMLCLFINKITVGFENLDIKFFEANKCKQEILNA